MRVHVPGSLDEACRLLAADRSRVPIAGATDLLVHWPVNLAAHDREYLDLSGLAELRPISWTADLLRLGALTTYWDVIRDPRVCDAFPLLPAAARQVGAIQIQARGTWAGNIMNGSPAADGVPVLMAYDATVVLRSVGGEQRVPLDRFYTGYKQMRRDPDQLVIAIELPRRGHTFAAFEKVGARRAQAITKVGAAIARQDTGSWRVVANSVAPTVRRCRAVEALLDRGDPIRGPEDLTPALASDTSPIDDIRSTADYRRTVLARVLYHALRGVCPGVT